MVSVGNIVLKWSGHLPAIGSVYCEYSTFLSKIQFNTLQYKTPKQLPPLTPPQIALLHQLESAVLLFSLTLFSCHCGGGTKVNSCTKAGLKNNCVRA